MTPTSTDQALLANMNLLAGQMGMLTGLSVSYGNDSWHQSLFTGFAREVCLTDQGYVPAPRPITPDTLYDLASLTKMFTLVSVLQLAEDGCLRLQDTIGRLDPRFSNLRDCTVDDCLCYLANLQTEKRIDQMPDADQAEAVLFNTRRAPLPRGRLYSDMNALVLGYVVEAVSGMPLFDYLLQRVLVPSGMAETWKMVPESRRKDLADYNYEHRLIDGSWQIFRDVFPGLPHDPKARLLGRGGRRLTGHAGLFSTAEDMCRFAGSLLSGRLLPFRVLETIGVNRTGWNRPGDYRQYLGQLCFAKSTVRRLSEVPSFMGETAFAQSGYTGNHLAVDPELGVFDLFLGNRCHLRLSQVKPEEQESLLGLAASGAGAAACPEGYTVKSSVRYVYQKDGLLHAPVLACLKERGWLKEGAAG